MLLQKLMLSLILLISSCSTYKGDGQFRISIGRDSGSEFIYKSEEDSLYYSLNGNETKSFKEFIETITAGIAAMAGTKAWKDGIENLR
jgi:hypothetical protein